MFLRSSPGLPSILFAYLGMRMPETCDRDWDVLNSTGVPLVRLLSQNSYDGRWLVTCPGFI